MTFNSTYSYNYVLINNNILWCVAICIAIYQYIEENVISFKEILDKANKKGEYWDGGSVLYQYKDFTIIEYQRLYDKNCDFIVIGNKNITIDDYCK